MLWPALEAVRALGGSGRIEEINEKEIEQLYYSAAHYVRLKDKYLIESRP